MSDDAGQVRVYAFLMLDRGVETPGVAPFKATRDAILHRFAGQVLEGTGQLVDADALDSSGRLMRVPTGWGELAI